MFDVIVVGAGIVGTSAAYRCLQSGARTLLIDGYREGQASQAAAGIITPTTEVPDGGPNHLLAAATQLFYPELLAQLAADGAPDTCYANCGELVIAQDDREAEELGQLLEALADPQQLGLRPSEVSPREISPEEARARAPMIGEVVRAVWAEESARIDGRMLNQAMRAAALGRGLEVATGTIERFMFDGERVSGVWIGHTYLAAANIVVACGAWSSELCRLLGVSLDVRPQRGQLAHLRLAGAETSESPIVRTMADDYIVPWPGGRIVVGATSEDEVGWDARATVGGARSLLDKAVVLAPTLADATFLEIRVGLRPVAARGYPLIGPLPNVDRCFIATGHGSNGLAYGPWSGYAVADLCLDREPPDLSAFAP